MLQRERESECLKLIHQGKQEKEKMEDEGLKLKRKVRLRLRAETTRWINTVHQHPLMVKGGLRVQSYS